MERKSLLKKYMQAALYRLRFEKLSIRCRLECLLLPFSRYLFLSLLDYLSFHIMDVSRLLGAVLLLVATIVFIVYKRYKNDEAVRQLDEFMPDNLLITAMDVKVNETHLAPAIIVAAELKVADAFERFKKREKRYVNPKMLGGFVIVICLFLPY